MKESSDFIEDTRLIDLQLEDASYTWVRRDQQEMASRIDRILISEEWDEDFNNLEQFESWWLGTAGFTNRVKVWWESFNFSGRPDYVLTCKLRSPISKLKEWNNEDVGNLGIQRKRLLQQLAELDVDREDRVFTVKETTKKAETLLEYKELIKNEQNLWRKKSRALRYNNIDQLMIQGELTKDPSRIESEIIGFYKNLYTESIQWKPAFQYTQCPVITVEEREALQGDVEESEVLRCLNMCATDKIPGPDGFTMGFYIQCWDIVKQDIMKVHNFHDQ
ncbi:unnamed protein product [Withania somnifera]